MRLLLTLLSAGMILTGCKQNNNIQLLPTISNGELERIHSFKSEFVPTRDIDVWLPPGYSDGTDFTVLYMHDGQNLFDSTITWNKQEWGVDEVLGKLILDKIIDPVIVVGIWNGGEGRHTEYFPQKPFEKLKETLLNSKRWQGSNSTKKTIRKFKPESDNYLKFLVTELKPHIDQNYKTNKNKAATYIAGSSMGGLISMYAICEYPEVFNGAACLSTHWPGLQIPENNPIPGSFIDYLNHNLPDPNNHKFYFDFGTETLDSLYEPYQIMVDGVMQLNGYTTENWMSKKYRGHDHSERSWNKRLDIPFKFLLTNK